MARTRWCWRIAAAVALLVAPGAAAKPPNILFVLIDALRADHVSAHGYPRATTPTLDALAARGVRFARAIAPSNRTITSMASIWTGLLPGRHGVFRKDDVLDARFETAAELLLARGYRTGAWCPNPSLERRFGLGQGWDTYDDDILDDHTWFTPRWQRFETAATINRRMLAWLDAAPGRPFLAWLHYRDVHGPYLPPPGYDRMFPAAASRPLTAQEIADRPDYLDLDRDGHDLEHYRSQYDGEIRYTDDQLAALLTALEQRGLRDDTIVIVTADHGEAFLEHGQWNHDATLHEEELHVPLVIAPAGGPARTVDRVVSTVDLFATMLALAGVPAPAGDGESLVPLLEGDDTAYRRERAYAESRVPGGGGIQRAVREARWKLILRPQGKARLYDLVADPGERRNVIAVAPEEGRRLADLLMGLGDRPSGAAASAPLDAGLRRQLEALGYVE